MKASIRLILGISAVMLVIVLVSYLTIVNPIDSEVVLRAQQYNITPYNTLYMFIIESPPITSMSVYNPNIFHGGLATYGLVQDFLASLNITSNTMVPDLAGGTGRFYPTAPLRFYSTLGTLGGIMASWSRAMTFTRQTSCWVWLMIWLVTLPL
jgi:peptide/nickel transport system substrate-binding protein